MGQNIIVIIESILWIIVLTGGVLTKLEKTDLGFKVSSISGSIFVTTLYYFGIINNTPLNNPFAFVVSLGFVMLFSCIVYLSIIFKIDF